MSQVEMPSFREKLKEILAATEYISNVTADQLISFENDENLQQFTEWFTLNVSEDNCLTPEEVEEFQKLQEEGEVLYGYDLDKALQSYEGTEKSPSHLNHVVTMNKQEQLVHLEDQLALKERLSSAVSNSVSSLDVDINKLKADLKKAKEEKEYALNNLNLAMMKYISKLNEMKTVLKRLHTDISSLEQDYETSADKGTDTFTSSDTYVTDQLNTSAISTTSTSSLLSTCKNTGLNTKFLCQLSFDKYFKQHRRFCRILDDIVLDKITKLIELSMNTKVDFDLEVKCLLERLSIQMKQLIYNEAAEEGFKAARKKISEILCEIRCKTFKPDEFLNSNLNESNMDVSISSPETDSKNFDEIFNQWKTTKTEEIQNHQREEMSAVRKLIHLKLDQHTELMKVKQSADTVFYHLLFTEEGKIEKTISIYESAYSNVKTKVNETKERLKIIHENIDDYAECCAQPGIGYSELLAILANVLGSKICEVGEAINELIREYSETHDDMVLNYENLMQHSIKEVQQLKIYHDDFMEGRKKQQDLENLQLFENILVGLDNINLEIQDTVLHCESLKNGEEDCPDENYEVEQMLRSILENELNQ